MTNIGIDKSNKSGMKQVKKVYKKPAILSSELLEVVAAACGDNAKASGDPNPNCFTVQNS